jgi:hypothetical protein
MKTKIYFSFILALFITVIASANVTLRTQPSETLITLNVRFKFSDLNNQEGVKVMVYEGSKEVANYFNTPKRGLRIVLEPNKSYTVKFEKEGYVRKQIIVRTPNANQIIGPVEFPMLIELFPLSVQLDTYYFTMAELVYNAKINNFVYDEATTEKARKHTYEYRKLSLATKIS